MDISFLLSLSDSLRTLLFEHVQYAHWIVFVSLMLAGLNIPFSEDIILVTSGVLASTLVPENTSKLFIAAFLGSYLSDWEAYWVGRVLGKNLWENKWFSNQLKPKRLQKIEHFYEKYGFWTLLIGRFIPFGIRNCLFITSGMTKMHFGKFILSDGVACLLSNTTLFVLGYYFAKNYDVVMEHIYIFNTGIFSFFLAILSLITLYQFRRKKAKQPAV